MRALVLLAGFVVAHTATAAAQTGGTKSAAPAAQQAGTQTKTAAPTKADAPRPRADDQSKAGAAQSKGAATKAGQGRPAITVAPESALRVALPPIMREVYDYDDGGRRDPFVSLLTSEDLRPMITDLRVVTILYDESGRRPIAVLREIGTNTQYRVTTGSTLGRLKVALIKRRAVIFSIEEFGLNRQDSLVLGDTTKARTR